MEVLTDDAPLARFRMEGEAALLVHKAEGIAARKQVMVLPYIPGIAQKLKKIAAQFQIQTWYTFPGKLSQQFMQHRGKLHRSKIVFTAFNAPAGFSTWVNQI